MSTTVFPFTMQRPYREWFRHQTTIVEGNNGVETRRSEFGDFGRFTARFSLRLPMSSYTVKDWHDFVTDRQGSADTFLFKAREERNKTRTLEALGTGDGSTTVFALDMKHVDASTLLVYKAAVLQTITTHYTFTGNNTAPVVTFLAAPTGGQAITATYDFYYPVRFASDDIEPEDLYQTSAQATSIYRVSGVEILEEYPGAHRV